MPDKSELMQIPGIGVALSRDLNSIEIKSIGDLKNEEAQKLYEKLCRKEGNHIDRCVLYAFRCAVYFASGGKEPRLLKWWNWKDVKKKASGRS